MFEEASGLTIAQQIADLENGLKRGFMASDFLRLTTLEMSVEQADGLSNRTAAVKVYRDGVQFLETRDPVFCSSDVCLATRNQLLHAIWQIEHERPDPVHTTIGSVKPALLSEKSARHVIIDDDTMLNLIIEDLMRREQLYGSYRERQMVRVGLQVKKEMIERSRHNIGK